MHPILRYTAIISLIFTFGCNEDKSNQLDATETSSQTLNLETKKQKEDYVIGYHLGKQLAMYGNEVTWETAVQGIRDGKAGTAQLENKEIDDTIREVMIRAQTKLKAQYQSKLNAEMEKNAQAGEAFLAANKQKDGVVELESGLQYRVIKQGSGNISPGLEDTVKINYEGRFINGTVFDASKEAATMKPEQLIKGWQEALLMMKAGDKWELVVPSHLAYGETGAGGVIGPNATLIFDVELLEVQTK